MLYILRITVSAAHSEELQDKVQVEADKSTLWISDNRMVCSGEKTKLLFLGTAQLKRNRVVDSDISVLVCGKTVTPSKSEKLLGLTVNEKMTWTEYLYGEQWRESDNSRGLISQLSQRVGLLKKLVSLMPKARFNMVCQGLFYSKLLYCLQVIGNVWGIETTDLITRKFSSFTKEDNRRLQTLQNQVLQMKTGLPPRTPTKTLLDISGDLSVQQLTAFATLATCHKIIQTGKPSALANKLYQGSSRTRNGISIRLEANLTLSRGAFLYRAAVLFSALPQNVREDTGTHSFKQKLRKWIKANVPVKPT